MIEATEETEKAEVTEQQEKVLTQADIDSAVKTRLAREQSAHEKVLAEERQVRADLELKLQEKKASEMTDSEHREAMQRALEATRAELEEFKTASVEKEKAAIALRIDNADEKALLEAGFNPKYSTVVLTALKASRGIEDGQPFYKNKEGAAIDRSAAIESLVVQYPELVQINRVQGNSVPTGQGQGAVDPSKETAEQFIARMQRERAQ